MQLEFRARGMQLASSLESLVRERLESSIRSGRGRLGRVIVRLEDVNGPRGGVDMRCSILAYLDGSSQTVHVEQRSENAFQAVAGAARRAARALERTFDRWDERRRPRRPA